MSKLFIVGNYSPAILSTGIEGRPTLSVKVQDFPRETELKSIMRASPCIIHLNLCINQRSFKPSGRSLHILIAFLSISQTSHINKQLGISRLCHINDYSNQFNMIELLATVIAQSRSSKNLPRI
jgi:hypothetical protein